MGEHILDCVASKSHARHMACIVPRLPNKQVAWELGLSERTVKMHRAAVFAALGVRTSADAIRLAIEASY